MIQRRALLMGAGAAASLGLGAGAARAHLLRVFAFVEDGQVVVEARFASGRLPTGGTVQVFDADGVLLQELPVNPDGNTVFPLPDGAAEGGLVIEVRVSEGHEDYWILTPEDIAAGMDGA